MGIARVIMAFSGFPFNISTFPSNILSISIISHLKHLFDKYGIKKVKFNPTQMTAEHFFQFVQDIAQLCTYDIVKLMKSLKRKKYKNIKVQK